MKKEREEDLTLDVTDLRPLLLPPESWLDLRAEGHMIYIVQKDPDHMTGQVTEPGDRHHFTELEREGERDLYTELELEKETFTQN